MEDKIISPMKVLIVGIIIIGTFYQPVIPKKRKRPSYPHCQSTSLILQRYNAVNVGPGEGKVLSHLLRRDLMTHNVPTYVHTYKPGATKKEVGHIMSCPLLDKMYSIVERANQ